MSSNVATIQTTLSEHDIPSAPAYLQLGILVVRWNVAEALLDEMLQILSTDQTDASIITAHMGTNTLCDALTSLAAEKRPKTASDHISHFIKLFKTTREYRNWYVHGPKFSGVENDSPGLAVHTRSARREHLYHQEIVTAQTLYEVTLLIDHLLEYGWQVLLALASKEQPPPWPPKPPLPDTLDKPRRRPQGEEPPRQE